MWLTGCCGGDAVSSGGDTYRIWAVFVYVCVGRLSGCGFQGAVEGMRFRVEETRTRFGRFLCTCVVGVNGFCVRVYGIGIGMWLTGCCGGGAVSGGGDTYRIRAVFVYVCVGRLSGCSLQGAVEGMRFQVEETRTRFGRFLCTCVWYRCRVVIYRVWEEGTVLVCYTKKKEITILVIPHEISLRYVLEATSP